MSIRKGKRGRSRKGARSSSSSKRTQKRRISRSTSSNTSMINTLGIDFGDDNLTELIPSTLDREEEIETINRLYSYMGEGREKRRGVRMAQQIRILYREKLSSAKTEEEKRYYRALIDRASDMMNMYSNGGEFRYFVQNPNEKYPSDTVQMIDLEPDEFIRLTATYGHADRIRSDKNSLAIMSEEIVSGALTDDMPYLVVDVDSGKVTDHEGRHRAVASDRLGIDRYPVALILKKKGDRGYYNRASEEYIGSIDEKELRPQHSI